MEVLYMRRFTFLIIAIAIILQANSIFAWNARHTLKTLSKTSPIIMIGEVSQVFSRIENKNGREVVYTYVKISVESVLKGKLDKSDLTVKMLGGRVGNKGGWSEELFQFKKDEEALLFLHSDDKGNNVWKINSISGKLPIIVNNSVKKFDCSRLKPEDVLQYKGCPYFKQEVIMNRIKDYIQDQKGGN